jgi:hypothetical protein
MTASGQLPAPAALLPEVHTRIRRTGDLVGTGAGLNVMDKRKISCLTGIESRIYQPGA